MGKYSKWIGGGLGWVLGGPIGGLLGFAAGALFDKSEKITGHHEGYGNTTQNDFVISLLVLTAAVMKADGKIVHAELDYVKEYFRRMFGANRSGQVIRMLGDLIKQEIPVHDVCAQISHNMDYSSRLQFMHFLFGIAQADGDVSASESRLISDIAGYLSISQADFNSIKSMFVKDNMAAYRILEVDKSASNEEVKKAYRKMAVKFHPDKVSYLGEEVQKGAKEKFQQLSDAYKQIKQERKIA
ncbi:MAG: molecular chaperone DjiA [Bacteroidota bacterium]|nr:molecular chaperone DjiA [Bacteroidota bacterium]